MASLKHSDNTVAYLDNEKSELLIVIFDENLSYIASFKLDFDINALTDIEFTPRIMHNKLINLDPVRDVRYYHLKSVHNS